MNRKKLFSLTKFLSFIIVFFINGCSSVVLFHSKGQVGQSESNLIIICALLMLIVVLPVIFLTFIISAKYRQSTQSAEYDPNWKSIKVEITIWFIPLIIIIILSTLIWIYSHRLDPYQPIPSNAKPLRIQVISMDWKWLFIYPDQQIATVNQLVIPEKTPVHFYLTSDTVINSFFIPQLGSQIMTMAGMQTQLFLDSVQVGKYDGISANFSGLGFNQMKFNVFAVTHNQFTDWVNKVKQTSQTLDESAYMKLELPNVLPVIYYSNIGPNFFNKVLIKYKQIHSNPTADSFNSENMTGSQK